MAHCICARVLATNVGMHMSDHKLIFALTIAISAALAMPSAHACTCDEPSLAEAAQQAKLAFAAGNHVEGTQWLFLGGTLPLTVGLCSGTQRASDDVRAFMTKTFGSPKHP
jgi:hypothetical protein